MAEALQTAAFLRAMTSSDPELVRAIYLDEKKLAELEYARRTARLPTLWARYVSLRKGGAGAAALGEASELTTATKVLLVLASVSVGLALYATYQRSMMRPAKRSRR